MKEIPIRDENNVRLFDAQVEERDGKIKSLIVKLGKGYHVVTMEDIIKQINDNIGA